MSRKLSRRHIHICGIGLFLVVGITLTVFFSLSSQVKGVVSEDGYQVFNQTDWSGGLDGGTTIIHPTDQDNWTKYSTTTGSISAGSGYIKLGSTTSSVSQTSDADFNGGTHSQTENISQSGSITLKKSLVGHWAFENNTDDSSGNNYSGSLVGGATYAAGNIGQALSLDGVDDYFSVADTAALDFGASTDFSISTWINTATSTQQTILDKENGDGYRCVYQGQVTRIWCSIREVGSADEVNIYSANGSLPSLNTWYHVVLTADRDGNAQMYINGAASGNPESLSGVIDSVDNNQALWIGQGGSGGSSGGYFNGKIDDTRVYNRALSLAEVQTLYQQGNISYYTSGDFTSAAVDVGQNSSFTTISWNATTSASTSVRFQIRSATTQGGLSSATWYGPTGTGDYYTSSGTTLNSIHNGDRWIQYKAFLTSTDTSVTPTLHDVTVGYTYYATSGQLVSSMYNTTDPANAMYNINWYEDASLPTGTSITMSIRTASTSSDLANASWSDFTNATTGCVKQGTTVTCPAPAGLSDHTGDQWFQYKLALTSTGVYTPTVTNVRINYTLNYAPIFESIQAYQNSTSSDANLGKVAITYNILDADTTTGYIIPSFEYNTGSGWQAITSQYLGANDTNNKAVDPEGFSYTAHTAIWDAKAQIGPNVPYVSAMQVRVTASDGAYVYSTSTATSAAFAFDNIAPSLTSFIANMSDDTVALKGSDNSTLQYKLSNNADLSADGVNATSGTWQTISTQSSTTTVNWTFSTTTRTVYLLLQDNRGNVAATTTRLVPVSLTNVEIKDTSNPSAGSYSHAITWGSYTSDTGVSFHRYEVWRSANGGSYSRVVNQTTQNTLIYSSTGLTASTTYAYRVRVVDTEGDVSEHVALTDATDGKGGSDTLAPAITSVQTASTQPTWAKITWTTDELSTSVISYGTTTSYGLTASSTAYETSHSITIPNLTPNTTYYYQVSSTDVSGNTGTKNDFDSYPNGYTFTTNQGTVISGVAVESATDQTATVIWNTSTNSNSYIVYSTSAANLASNTDITEVGTADLVAATSSNQASYQHRVSLSGLTPQTIYHFYVKSTDADTNTAIDTNNGSYYTFLTTNDTVAPVISNIITPAVTSNSAVVMWQTDELSDSQVLYGTQSGTYNMLTTLDPTRTISHMALISGLDTNALYYFVVRSSDAQNNTTVSTEQMLTTASGTQTTIIYAGGTNGLLGETADKTVPIISGISASSTGPFTAKIAFTTNELTTAYVLYGRPVFDTTVANASFSTSHEITIKGLQMGATYQYQVKVQDKNGNFAESATLSFTTPFATEPLQDLVTLKDAARFETELGNLIESMLPSLVPPFISEISIASTTENSAIIKWMTNVPTYGSVLFVPDSEVTGSAIKYTQELSQTQAKTKEHTIELKNLTPATKYHFSVSAYTLPGVVRNSEDMTFATKASKIKPEVTKVGNKGFEIRWYTPQKTSSVVEYTDKRTGKSQRMEDPEKVTSHSVKVEDALSDTVYSIRAYGYDQRGVVVEGDSLSVRTGKDSTPPSISSVRIDNALIPGRNDRLQTVVSWLTSEPANSKVYYEEGVGNTPLTTNINQAVYTNEHILIVPSLKPSTVYRIQVVSTDESGNTASSTVKTILTPHSTEDVIDVIIKNLQDSFGFLKKIQ